MYYAIFSVSGEDLEPLPSIELFNLLGPLSAGSLALALSSDTPIYACLIYEDQLFGAKKRYLVYVLVA